MTLEQLIALHARNLVISPGPGHPLKDSGVSMQAIMHFAGKIPIFGVCMGLQTMYAAYSGIVEFAGEIVHGKTSLIEHDGKGLYAGLDPNGVVGTRYHSLAAKITTLPPQLAVTSKTASGVVMGIRHTQYAMEAIQFHPEGILSCLGKEMIANFLTWESGTWEGCPQAQILPEEREASEKITTPELSMKSLPHVGDGEAHPSTRPAPLSPEEAQKNAIESTLATQDAALAASKSAQEAVSLPATTTTINGEPRTILQRIHAQRLLDIAAAQAVPGQSLADLETSLRLNLAPSTVNLVECLRCRRSQGTIAIMAEMKRASPSKGLIDPLAHAAVQARTYALGGASVVSVLTETHWFKGTLQDLRMARAALEGLRDRPAVLRKDFIVDKYQIAEARLAGADTVLLIVAMFPNSPGAPGAEVADAKLKALYDYSVSLGMEPLVEVNCVAEMERALRLGAQVIGVNNRNLHDFNVDMGTTSRLVSSAGGNADNKPLLAALSGISSRSDVQKYVDEGVDAVLVGEALMRAQDTKAFMHHLLGLSPAPGPPTSIHYPPTSSASRALRPLVKVCGLRDPSAAQAAVQAGADLLGIILVPGTKRSVAPDQAREIIQAVRVASAQRASTASQVSSQDHENDNVDAQPWFQDMSEQLRRACAQRPLVVGVFRNQPLQTVRRVAYELDLDVVQLHGSLGQNEPVEWARWIPGKWVFQMVSLPGPDVSSGDAQNFRDKARIVAAFQPSYHHLVGVDAGSGGTGQVIDWQLARSQTGGCPFLLAGGLTPENVREAILAAGDGVSVVDTSSGVESQGAKDHAKITAFVRAAKAART